MATLIKHKDSHVDHGLTPAQLGYIFGLFADVDRAAHGLAMPGVPGKDVMVETIALPEWLGTVSCALRGPLVGDEPITGDRVTWETRGTRDYTSRMVELEPLRTQLVTVVAGPHDGHDLVLFTAYGGPAAPRETNDIARALNGIAYRIDSDGTITSLSPDKMTSAAVAKVINESKQAADFWMTHALASINPPFVWTVELGIAEKWVGDGAELTTERMHDIMTSAFPYFYGHEVTAKVIAAPDPDRIAIAQGYQSAADKAEREAKRRG